MKIAVDFRLVSRNPYSGMGVYVTQIFNHLKKVDPKNVYETFDFKFKGSSKSILSKIFDLFREQIWVQIDLPRKLGKGNYDVVYFPNPPIPMLLKSQSLLTIPDLSFIYDKNFNFLIKAYLYINYFLAAHKASFITTFSKNSKKDIEKYLKVSSQKISIVTPALGETHREKISLKEINQVLNKYEIDKKYILSVPGTFIPRKNTKDLILAFSNVRKSLPDIYNLVLVGNNKDLYFQETVNFVKELGLEEGVIFTGYVSDKELLMLYKAAKLFVFPSLYEGFGLPPLEAMSCGVPTIVYNNSSLPEVVDKAGVIVNNREELEKAILKVLKNKKISDELIKLGEKRALEYSWYSSAKNMLSVLQKINLN